MVGDTILIKDISINGNDNLTNATKLSETLTDNTINALGIDASSRTIWINGQPYGNAYVNIKEDNTTVEAPIGAEIFNDFEHNIASGDYSHAEGRETSATGDCSHAEGRNTSATGDYSHAEGRETSATGDYSHASGFYTKTTNTAEVAFGQFNQSTEGSTIFSIGDGDSDSSRHNIVEVTDNEVNINTNLKVEDNLTVDRNTTIGGTLSVTGNTTVSTLESSGNVDLESLDVEHNTTIGGTLSVTGNTTVSTLESSGNVDLESLDVEHNTTIRGTLDVTGKTSVSTLESSGNVDLESLDVEHNTTIGGTLGVTGNTTSKGNIVGENNLRIIGETYLENKVAAGEGALVTNESEIALGRFNKSTKNSENYGDEGNTAFSVGIGESIDNRKNAVEVMQNGDVYINGIGKYDGTNPSDSKDLATILSTVDTSNEVKFEVENQLIVDGPAYLRTTVAAGNDTTASGEYSHAEGYGTVASKTGSHSEGIGTQANGDYSHAEGNDTKANGNYSHTVGSHNVAEGENSSLQGYYLFDHGIDTENSFIWLQSPGETSGTAGDGTASPTSEISGMNQAYVLSSGCGYIRIGDQHLIDPENSASDVRKGFYKVTGSFFQKGPIANDGWELKMGINDSYEYYISLDDLTAIATSWDDSGLYLTPEFKIYKYTSSSTKLDLVTTVQGCNWVRSIKYSHRIEEIGNIYKSNPDIISIKNLYTNNFKPNTQPTKFTNNNATIIGQYNKPRPDNIFEVGCGELPDGMSAIKQCNAISVKSTGETTITDLTSDNIVANTIKVSNKTGSSINTQLSATSIAVTAFSNNNTTITQQIAELPNESVGALCKTVICCDGILIGYSPKNYVYLTIDKDNGNVSLTKNYNGSKKTANLNWN